jgi:hypothetical protein
MAAWRHGGMAVSIGYDVDARRVEERKLVARRSIRCLTMAATLRPFSVWCGRRHLVRETEIAAPTSMVRRCMLPLRDVPALCFPALSWLPGRRRPRRRDARRC